MSDKETVSKAVEYLNWYFTQDDGTADKNAVKAWKELLREQEPVKAVRRVEETEWNVCSNCGGHIISKWKWCPYCGKAVKWDE